MPKNRAWLVAAFAVGTLGVDLAWLARAVDPVGAAPAQAVKPSATPHKSAANAAVQTIFLIWSPPLSSSGGRSASTRFYSFRRQKSSIQGEQRARLSSR